MDPTDKSLAVTGSQGCERSTLASNGGEMIDPSRLGRRIDAEVGELAVEG
jgi:hypothetical protein